jgi:hypothetical protein
MIAPFSRSTACSALCAKCPRPSFILAVCASGSCDTSSLGSNLGLTLAVELRQIVTHRALNARRLGQPGQKIVIALPRLSAIAAAQCYARPRSLRPSLRHHNRFPFDQPSNARHCSTQFLCVSKSINRRTPLGRSVITPKTERPLRRLLTPRVLHRKITRA